MCHQIGRKNLQRDVTAERRIDGVVHSAHPSRTEKANDAIASNLLLRKIRNLVHVGVDVILSAAPATSPPQIFLDRAAATPNSGLLM